MATTPTERQEILTDLSTVAIRDLVTTWRRAALVDGEFPELMAGAFVEVATTYAQVSATLAAQWYTESAPLLSYEPVLAAPNVEAFTQSAQWALGADGEAALNRMSGSAQRAVFDGARDTITLNVQSEPGARWVRHARPDACAFCRLMATRHTNRRSWYKTATSAVDVVGRAGRARGSRAVGSRGFHDFCRCIAVEVRRGQEYTPPEYVQQWDEQYAKARANAGRGDMKSILSAWREQGVK